MRLYQPPKICQNCRVSPLKTLALFLALAGAFASRARAESPVTIKNDRASLTVSLTPEPRITSYQRTGQPSLLLDDPGYDRTGMRFFALEEKEGRQAGTVFGGQARWIEQGPDACTFESVLADKNLQLTVALKFAPDTTRVTAHCTLRNTAGATRKLALWGIASVPPKGWIVSTISRGIENGGWVAGRLSKFFMSDGNDRVLKMGRDALTLDLSQWHREGSPKFGTRANEAWIAVARPDLQTVLLMLLPYQSSDRYPDDDSNVTMWFGTTPSNVPYAEAEWLSPWREVAAGKDFEWTFAFEARDLPAMETVNPDTLLTAIRHPQKLLPQSPADTTAWRLSVGGPLLKDSFQRVTEFYGPGGILIAKAPIWYDAPLWSEAGVTWLDDTLVEAVAATIPDWSEKGRTWRVAFSGRDDAALLREGDEAGGFSLFVSGGKIHAALWNGSEGVLVSAPLADGAAQDAKAWIEDKTLKLQVGDAALHSVAISFSLPSPAKRLALARDSTQPKGLKLPLVPKFRGPIREISITP